MLYRSCAGFLGCLGGWLSSLDWVKSGHLPRHKNHFKRLIKGASTFPYVGQILSRLLRIIEWNQINTRAAGIIVVHSKFVQQVSQTIHTSISCAYLAKASGSAQCAVMSQWWCVRAISARLKTRASKQVCFPCCFALSLLSRLLQIGAARQEENR